MPATAQSLVFESKREPVDVDYWLRLFETVQGQRANFDSHWSSVAQRMWPEADQFRTARTPGEKRRQFVYSSHASRALRKWVRIVISLAAPKTSQWQKLLPDNEDLAQDPAAKVFFEEFTRRVSKMRMSPRTRFYETLQPTLSNFGAFGNGCYFIEEVPGGSIDIPVPLSQVWIAIDHLRRVQTVFYKYPMSAAAAHMKWREVWGDDPPPKVREALAQRPWDDMQWLHVVTPRGNVDPDALGPDAMPWRSLHFGLEDRVLVTQGGYYEMPFIFARDMVEAGEIYGRGAGMMFLPEAGALDAMKKTHLVTGERKAAPPVLLSDDYDGAGKRVNLLPDGLNYGALNSKGEYRMRPWEGGENLDITLEMMQEEKESIDDALGLNLFRMLFQDPSEKTAYQVAQELAERGQMIGPWLDSVQSEMFGLETERRVGIMSRQGLLPEIPPVVAEAGGYRIQHTGPANQLQREGEISAITRAMAVVQPLAENDPGIWRKFRPGKVIDRVMEIQGGPTEVLVPEEEYEEMRAAEAEQAAQAQQGAMAEQGAGALKDGMQALTLLQGGAQGGAA